MSEIPSGTVPVAPAPPLPPTTGSAAALPLLPAHWRVLAGRWLLAVIVVLTIVSVALAWRSSRRVGELEQELVRRQQDSAVQSTEARLVARDAQDSVRDAAAKVALLEARVAEVAVQRGQLEDLIQSLSRSRDENLLGDVEAAIQVAVQQSAITGSAEPLVAALHQADERLARYDLPRLENVRRAIGRDLDRIKAVGVADVPSLAIKLDEAIRLVDDLPLLASAEAHHDLAATTEAHGAGAAADDDGQASAAASGRLVESRGGTGGIGGTAGTGGSSGIGGAGVSSSTSGASSTGAASSTGGTGGTTGAGSGGRSAFARWTAAADGWWRAATGDVWSEVRALIRVSRVDHPDAMLLAPEQAFFVRENLKLRLLNARLALLSRQFDIAQSDMTVARAALDRYFERRSRRTQLAVELIAQTAAQSRQVNVPRPDDTLAALTAAGSLR